jgi:hypothetical protein
MVMLKSLIVIPILFLYHLGWSADLVCSLRKAPIGKITGVFSSGMTEKCLPECGTDAQKQIENNLDLIKENIRPLTKIAVEKLSATQVIELYKKLRAANARDTTDTIAEERAGKITRKQLLERLNDKSQSARLESASRAYTKYQDAVIRGEWQKAYVNIGLSTRLVCAIQTYKLESEVFELIGNVSILSESQKKAVLDLISKHTEEPPPASDKESSPICQAYNTNKSIPLAFSNAIMQNCL